MSRTEGEGVVLVDAQGKQIARVFVQRMSSHQVKLGFEAGPEVSILRDELVDDGETVRRR